MLGEWCFFAVLTSPRIRADASKYLLVGVPAGGLDKGGPIMAQQHLSADASASWFFPLQQIQRWTAQKHARSSAALLGLRLRLWSSPKQTSIVQCSLFSIPQWPRTARAKVSTPPVAGWTNSSASPQSVSSLISLVDSTSPTDCSHFPLGPIGKPSQLPALESNAAFPIGPWSFSTVSNRASGVRPLWRVWPPAIAALAARPAVASKKFWTS